MLAFVLLILGAGTALVGLAALVVMAARAGWWLVASRRKRRHEADLARRRRGRAGRLQRAASITTAAAVGAFLIAAYSYAGAMATRSNSSLAIKSVEWLRGNGAAWLVSDVEHAYYSMSAPSKGGPALVRLPTAGVDGRTAVSAPRRSMAEGPKAISPVIRPALPGEGKWHATQDRYAGRPDSPLLVTTYRPDPSYPRVVAGVARVNSSKARIALYPGVASPPGGRASGLPTEIPQADRSGLLAAFNSGFKFSDAPAGFFAGGRLLEPMRPGLATLVGTQSGRLDIRSWSGGARPGPDVAFARQNLPLIVDRGQPSPALSDGPEWGTTVGNSVMVWRSGLGITRHRDLIYAAANYQTVRGLAGILVHAGAVRAMELDINSYWVTLNTYRGPNASGAQKLLAGMDRPATRYLAPDDRDFFAIYAR